MRWLKGLLILAMTVISTSSAFAEITYTYYNNNAHDEANLSFSVPKRRPLLLWIHGCRQDEKKFVEYSEIVEKTRHLNPLIIAPEINTTFNPLRCWNFLSGEMETRDGKFMTVIQEIKKHIDSGEVDPDRIFVGGFSSGAVFANRLALCYPDIFKGAIVHSGGPFQIRDARSLNAAQEGTSRALSCAHEASIHRLKTLLYVHGTIDPIMPILLGHKAFEQSISYMDYMDDGVFNSSYTSVVNAPRTQYVFSNSATVNFLEIAYMSHRWSGSKAGSAFSSPKTPSAVDEFLKLTHDLQ